MALVLHLDENNSNSWSGEPTVNYFDNSTGTLQTTGNYSVTAVTTTPTGNNWPGGSILNRYVRVNAPQTWGSESQRFIWWGGLSTSTAYRVSFRIRKVSGTGSTIRWGMYGQNTPYQVALTTDWQEVKNYLTSHPSFPGVEFGSYSGDIVFEIAFMQCEIKDYSTNFVNGTRTNFADLSTNGNDGDVSNMTFTEEQQGLVYNNSNYVSIANSATIALSYTGTISFWMKPTSFNAVTWTNIMNKVGATSYQRQYSFWLQSAGYVHFSTGDGTTNSTANTTTGGIVLNTWYNIVGVMDRTSNILRIYVNGALDASDTITTNPAYATTTPLNLGYSSEGVYGKFSGNISSVKIWDTVLSTEQVQKEYNRNRIRYNKPPIEGVYSPNGTPGPLLYEFNCLTDTSLRGEETENLVNVNTIVFYTGYSTNSRDGANITFTLKAGGSTLVFSLSEIADINGRTFSYSGTIKKNGVPYNQTNNQFSSYSGTTSIYSIDSTTGEFYGTRTYSTATAWILHWPISGTTDDVFTIENFQIEEKAYATPFTPEYRYNWQSLRNLSDKEFYGYFMNSGFTTPPQIDTSDYNGLKLEASSTTVGNFVVLQKPNIITDGLVLHLDAGDKDSYPGSGTTWSDLSGDGNDFTIIGSPTHADDAFTINETQGFDRTSIPTNSTTATFVIFYKTTDTQELWATGQTNAYYIAASNSNNYYHSNAGSPTNYIDLTARTNPTTYKDGNYHMWEAKNVNLSAWTELEFWQYGTSWNMNGTVAIILVYDRALTADESKQNFNALRGRFSI